MSVDMTVLRQVQNGLPWAFCVWEPSSAIVVVGRSGIIENEVETDSCRKDRIPVMQRRTGGGTVVLSPGVLVFSLGRIVEKPLVIREYVNMINGLVVEFLAQQEVRGIKCQGISDLCISGRKIMGSGMYRRGRLLFFQGSILVNPDISLMDRYLKHPPKEPDYRKGRSHGNFVTSLQKEGFNLTAGKMKNPMIRFLEENIERIY